MALSTVYDVKVRYLYEDRGARAGVSGLRQEIATASRESSAFGGTLSKLAGLAAGAFGFHKAKEAFVDFNSDMEQSKITMAGLFQLNVGGEFADNMSRASDMVLQLQQRAKASVGTTKDMVEMASMLANPVTAAGASMKELEDVTVGVVVAARSLNIEPSMAALDIQQALQGSLNKKDRFARALLEHNGMTTEKFNALGERQRFDEVMKAVRGPAVREMAKAQEFSFAGVFSTLQDNIQMRLGKAGKQVFGAITSEIKGWNEWIDKNGDALDRMGQRLSDALVEGLGIVKDVGKFFYDHADTLESLAKLWIGAKIGSGILGAGGIGGLLGGSGGMAQMLTQGVFGTGLSVAGNALMRFAGPIGLAVAGLYTFSDYLSRHFGKESVEAKRRVSLVQLAADASSVSGGTPANAFASTRSLARFASDEGLLSEDKKSFAPGLADSLARALQSEKYDFSKGGGQQAEEILRALQRIDAGVREGLFSLPDMLDEKGKGTPELPSKADQKSTGAPTININHIEVASEDPDRFVARLSESVSSLAHNPASAVGALRRM